MTLFDPHPLPDPAGPVPLQVRDSDPDTSKEAALADPGSRTRLRGRLLYVFFTNPIRGLTTFEMTGELDIHFPLDAPHWQPSVDGRRRELVELGWLEPFVHQGAHLTRMANRGVAQLVWRLTPQARTQGFPPRPGAPEE